MPQAIMRSASSITPSIRGPGRLSISSSQAVASGSRHTALPSSRASTARQALRNASSRRWASSSSHQTHTSGTGPLPPPPPPPSKHRLYYRELIPPLFRVLAYSSAVYFGLHLAWSVLERDEQRKLNAMEIHDLQTEAKAAAEKAERQVITGMKDVEEKTKGWWSWATGR
jgi:hypothetical protein